MNKFNQVKKYLKWIVKVFVSSGERFYWGNGFSTAASLAYTSLLSLVPVTFVVFAFLATFALGQQELENIREFIFHQFIPNQSAVEIILEKITEIQTTITSSNFSTLSICVFVVTAVLLINSIESSLNEIWQVYEPRTISQRITIFCAILVVAPLLIASAYYTTKFRLEPLLSELKLLASVSSSINQAFSFLLDFLAFFAIYYLVPKAPVTVRSAMFGAIITTLLFDFAKSYFTFYLINFTSYDKIYGALAVFPIFIFWLFVTWSIILLGAQCSFQFQHLPLDGKIWRKQATSIGDATMILACQVLVMVAKSYYQEDKNLNEFDIADKLGVSSLVLSPVIQKLKEAQILARSDTRDAPLLLIKSPDRIKLSSIVEIKAFQTKSPETLKVVSNFLQNLSSNQLQTTLSELIKKD